MMITFTSYNNVSLPGFMYGTAWKKEATAECVRLAVHAGFRAIDTANQLIHYNEALVGEALQSLSAQNITRESLFLQTKFTPRSGQDHRTPYDPLAPIPTQVQQSFDSSLTNLKTDYLDSYVLHGPYSRYGLVKEDWEVWTTMERLYEEGRTKLIGVSNVTVGQLQNLYEHANVKPMVVQNRCYARFGWDREVRQFCKANHIIYQAFSLLTANPEVLRHPAIANISERVGAGVIQVIFRFAQQIGMLPLTGTTNPQHMKEDLAIEEFTLTEKELSVIEQAEL